MTLGEYIKALQALANTHGESVRVLAYSEDGYWFDLSANSLVVGQVRPVRLDASGAPAEGTPYKELYTGTNLPAILLH